MAPPPLRSRTSRWARRSERRREDREDRRLLDAGDRPKLRRRLFGGVGGGWASRVMFHVMSTVMMVGIVLSFVGPVATPIRSTVTGWYHSIMRTVHPTYVSVNPASATASTAADGHPAIDAVDGQSNTYWEASGPPAVGQTLTINFGSASRVDRVGFLIGVQNPAGDYLREPRPQLVHLAFSDGSSADISLQDSSSFQAFGVSAKSARSVQVTVESTYASQLGQNVAITEVEFFAKK